MRNFLPLLDPPGPIRTFLGRRRVGDVTVSCITRVWHEGDCLRCQLCPECGAAENVCLVMTGRAVTEDEAAGFVLNGVRPVFGRN